MWWSQKRRKVELSAQQQQNKAIFDQTLAILATKTHVSIDALVGHVVGQR